jgi:peptide/nickel transport system substrate-binding protein
MKAIRLLVALSLVAPTLAGSTACTRVDTGAVAGEQHPWTIPGHLRIGSPDEPDNINPMFAHTDATDQVDALIFAPLFRYGPRGDFVPELATVVPTYANGGISHDSKTIVLHLRKGVRWSDGVPLTARDLRFTWRAVMNPRNNTKADYGWTDISAIDVPNDETAIVHMREPNANVLGLFGGGGGAAYPPLPEHLLSKLPDINSAPFNAAPISSGPFLLKTWNHGSSLEFVPNPRYWRGPPKLASITWKIVPNPDTLFEQLSTHEIDVLPTVPDTFVSRLAAIQGLRIVKTLSANWRRLAINAARPGLREVEVRRAIAEAVDWDRMNRTVYHGNNVRAHSDLPPDSWAAPDVPLYPYDPAGANRMLDHAGWRRSASGVRTKNGESLRFVISATNKPGNEDAEVQMQQELAAAGIELTIKNYPASVLFAQDGPLYTGHYDMEWSIDTNGPDPDNQGNWSGDFIPPKGANTSFLRDDVITRTSEAAIRTFDRAKRKALYQQEEMRIHELVPVVFLYWAERVSAYNDDLHGYRPAQYITDNWNAWEWSI